MTEQKRVVKVSRPHDLIQAVPYLLGYRPHEQLVLLELRGPRRRLGTCAAVELPPPQHLDAGLRPAVAALARESADRALAVLYLRRVPSSTGALPDRRVVRALRELAAEHEIALEDVLAVWEDRWWSYLCRDPRCCPAAGNLMRVAATPAVVAALVAEGAAPAASRDALAGTLDPVTGVAAAAMRIAVGRAREQAVGPGPVTRAATVALVEQLLAGGASQPAVFADDDEAATVLVGLTDLGARDAALCLVTDSSEEGAALDVFRDLVRRAPMSLTAPVAVVLAWTAYLHGKGALANVSVDRALAADPRYTMGLILREALDAGVHPRWLSLAVADLRDQVMPSAG